MLEFWTKCISIPKSTRYAHAPSCVPPLTLLTVMAQDRFKTILKFPRSRSNNYETEHQRKQRDVTRYSFPGSHFPTNALRSALIWAQGSIFIAQVQLGACTTCRHFRGHIRISTWMRLAVTYFFKTTFITLPASKKVEADNLSRSSTAQQIIAGYNLNNFFWNHIFKMFHPVSSTIHMKLYESAILSLIFHSFYDWQGYSLYCQGHFKLKLTHF